MTQADGARPATLDSIEIAISDVRQLLAADGFALTVHPQPDGFELRVEATAADCEDCLVPQEVLRAIVSEALQRHDLALGHEQLRIVYPNEQPR